MVRSLRDSPSRARPWAVRGWRVRSRTVSRRTWIGQRWTLVSGHVVAMAFRAPGAPSVVVARGAGMGDSSARWAAVDSPAAHCRPMTPAVPRAMSRTQSRCSQMPSMNTWSRSPASGRGAGTGTCRHQRVRRRGPGRRRRTAGPGWRRGRPRRRTARDRRPPGGWARTGGRVRRWSRLWWRRCRWCTSSVGCRRRCVRTSSSGRGGSGGVWPWGNGISPAGRSAHDRQQPDRIIRPSRNHPDLRAPSQRKVGSKAPRSRR